MTVNMDARVGWDHWEVSGERSAFVGDLPGSRRSPCLGCGEQVRAARDAHVQIGGLRDGSWLIVIDAEPDRALATDVEAFPTDALLLGVAHRDCLLRAKARLEAQEVQLPSELPSLSFEEPDDQPPVLHRPPHQDECPFCGRTDDLTDEHVWPDWVSRALRQGTGGFTVSPDAPQPRRTRSLDLTVRLCAPCNNRWLSVLEGDVAPLLGPMIRGSERTLDLDEQRLLATWAVKMALMIDLIEPDGAIIPAGCYRQFRQLRRPLPTTAVWIAGYLGNRWAAWGRREALGADLARDGRPLAFVTTFTVFRVVFQVWGHFTTGGATFRDDRWQFAPAIDAIWPPRAESIAWPRGGHAFGDESLLDFAQSVTDTKVAEEPTATHVRPS